MGLLRHDSGGFRTSRGVAMVGIVALHVVAVAVAMAVKGPKADAEAQSVPIAVMVLQESKSASPPTMKVKMEELLPQPIAPVIQIDVPVEPTTSITVAAMPTPTPPVKASPPPSDGDEGPVSVSNVDYVRMPVGIYPPAAKKARAQGTVLVRALVDVDGHAREVQVARSSGFSALDKAACDAVLGALFKPHRRNNVARSMVVLVPIDFFLNARNERGRGPGAGRDHNADSQLDVGGEHHHAMRGHAEELGGLSATALHVGE